MITFDESKFKLKPLVKSFIQDYIELIDNNDFYTLYSKAQQDLTDEDFTEIYNLTEALYIAGVDPLNYMKQIPPYFLSGSQCVTSVIIPEGIEEVGHNSFTGSSVETLIIKSSSLYIIRYLAFMDCTNLQTVELNLGLETIDPSVFEGCSQIEELHLPKTVKILGDSALYDCDRLKLLEISQDILLIEDYNLGDIVMNDGEIRCPKNKVELVQNKMDPERWDLITEI